MITGAQGRWWVWPHELQRAGVLGINQRNLAFIQESNRLVEQIGIGRSRWLLSSLLGSRDLCCWGGRGDLLCDEVIDHGYEPS